MLLSISSANAATYYVNPAAAHATDNGRGSSASPFKTLGTAVSRLAPGDALIVAQGVYRESIDLRQTQLRDLGDATPATRIDAAPGANVVIKGSDVVQGWQRLAPGLFVKRQWSINSQQVFVDGVALKQIGGDIFGGFPHRKNHRLARLHASQGGIWPKRVDGGVPQLVDNSFYYDAAAQILYVKVGNDDLDQHVVEVSARPYLLIGNGVSHLLLRHLHFEHANTTDVSQAGALTLDGHDIVLDDVHVRYVDGNGFDITGDRNRISRSSANYCGQVGMKVRGKQARLIDNETSYNNTRGFNKWWEAGGAKFVGAGGLQDSEISGHRAYGNNGDGIWFDWKNQNNRLHDSIVAYNSGMGIHYEASAGAQIYNNYVFGNKQRGIYLPKSSRSVIANNLVVGNGMEGIAIIDENVMRPELEPRNNRVVANVLGWNGKSAIVLPSKSSDNLSDGNLFLDAQPPALSMGWGTREQPVLHGLSAWRQRTGQDKSSWQQQLSMPPTLAAELQAQALRPDWSLLREHRGKLHVAEPVAGTSIDARPGPKEL
ncbi:MAG: right-handed parallel beta-helix repeat-containing protein [Gammaproteobacteria bacterium]|nr:right-handed parallel beta-helix repeat-containing protein [Gammaproteobacteria bacterium]